MSQSPISNTPRFWHGGLNAILEEVAYGMTLPAIDRTSSQIAFILAHASFTAPFAPSIQDTILSVVEALNATNYQSDRGNIEYMRYGRNIGGKTVNRVSPYQASAAR